MSTENIAYVHSFFTIFVAILDNLRRFRYDVLELKSKAVKKQC